MKTVYHVDYNLTFHSYTLSAYRVKKETAKRYYVERGTTILGGSSWRSFLDKEDKGTFTDFELAQAAIVAIIEKMIERNQNHIWQMQNNIEFVKKLAEENWRDVVGTNLKERSNVRLE